MRVLVAQQKSTGPMPGEVVMRRREFIRGEHCWLVRIRFVQDAQAAREAAIAEGRPDLENSKGLEDYRDLRVAKSRIGVALAAAKQHVDQMLPHNRMVLLAEIEVYAFKSVQGNKAA